MTSKHKVRVRDGFSDRNSINPISKIIKIDDFDEDTRISLFNALNNIIDYQIQIRNLNTDSISKIIIERLFNEIYRGKYKDTYESVINDILSMFKTEPYDIILTMIEFLCDLVFESRDQYFNHHHFSYSSDGYVNVFDEMNKAFEEEYIGYRFVNGQIIRITNDEEIETITEATITPFDKVNESIKKSISFISETSNKDYKNSIKESIIAVEQLFNIILGTSGLTLSNALEQICSKIEINENLKQAIKNLYKYANDSNGIRHGNNKKEESVSFDEAKLILIICSGIVNYFSKYDLKK